MDITAILGGMASGASYGLMVWQKQAKPEGFDIKKMATTVAIGAVAGIALPLMGLDVPMAFDFLINAGAVVVVENLGKIVMRRVGPMVAKLY